MPRTPRRALSAKEASELGEQARPAVRWFQDEVNSYLSEDRRFRGGGQLVWHEWIPGVIRTVDRRYAIVRVFLPDHGPEGFTEQYMLREAHFSTDSWGPNFLGITAGDYPRLDFALAEAEMRAWKADVGDAINVADTRPGALAYKTYAAGGRLNGLAVERTPDGRIVVSIRSKKRAPGNSTEEYLVAELDITNAVTPKAPRPKVDPLTTDDIILREAIMTSLIRRAGATGLGILFGLVDREMTFLGLDHKKARTIRKALGQLVTEGWVTRTPDGEFLVTDEKRRELSDDKELLTRAGRLRAVRDELFDIVRASPGSTRDELLDLGTFFGSSFEAAAELRTLITEGRVVTRDGKHYDRADAVGLHIISSQKKDPS